MRVVPIECRGISCPRPERGRRYREERGEAEFETHSQLRSRGKKRIPVEVCETGTLHLRATFKGPNAISTH